MELLRLVTLVYAGVLVLALAVSLTAVLVYLRRIASALAETRRSLRLIRESTTSLEQHLAPAAEQMDRAGSLVRDAAVELRRG